MNDPHHQPDLTAYALGELDHANDAAVHAWLLEHPEAHLEVDAVSDLAHAMQASAVLPTLKLHAEQRRAVLSGPQRVREMVAAASRRSHDRPRSPVILSVVQATLKFSAVAAVVAAAFLAGRHFEAGETMQVAQADPVAEKAAKPSLAADKPSSTPRAVSIPNAVLPASDQQPAEAIVAPKVEVVTAPVEKAPAMVVAQAPLMEKGELVVADPKASAAQKSTTRVPEAITRIASGPMLNTTQAASSLFTIRPAETRPIAESKGGLAAPVKASSSAPAAAKERAPVLLIHSWRAEVATCPWNAARKLVRVSLQIPGEQAAAAGDFAYGMQVTFHANHIRSYRALCQRLTPAAEKDGAATFNAWYEVIPNGVPSDVARTIGQVTLTNTRFTIAAMSPFDGSKLQLVDRGEAWEKAPDDFVFESAVVGFGLLMNGKPASEGLNHQVVLNLAERAQKASDRHGDRARFVKLVKDVRQAVGLKS